MEQSVIYIGAGLLIGLGAIGSAVGLGVLGSKFIESIARQPARNPIRHDWPASEASVPESDRQFHAPAPL